MGVSVYDYLLSEATSSQTGGWNTAEGQAPSTVNDGMRQHKQNVAAFLDDIHAVNTVAGSGDAITVTLAQGFTAYGTAAGQIMTGVGIRLIAPGTNTGAATLNVNAIGTKKIRKISAGVESALAAGDIASGDTVFLIYRSTADTGTGAWILLSSSAPNPLSLSGSSVGYTPFQGISTEAAAAAGPIFDLYRNSASPAAADFIGEIDFTGQNSTPAKKTYATIGAQITDATAATEDAAIVLKAMLAGTLTTYAYLGANAAGTATANAVGLPLGQLSFPATSNDSADANTLDDYEEGTWTPAFSASGSTFAYTTQYGRYTKIGRVVHVEFRIVLNTSGNTLTANVLSITGLPFTSGNTSNIYGYLAWSASTSSYVTMNVTLASASTSFVVGGATAAATTGTTSQLANAVLHATNGSFVGGVFTYTV
ncbi:MAG TPA: hypothetical protein VN639_15745 [Azonexus sp.]|nr:hypothetical protein [Azonexus sp.]